MKILKWQSMYSLVHEELLCLNGYSKRWCTLIHWRGLDGITASITHKKRASIHAFLQDKMCKSIEGFKIIIAYSVIRIHELMTLH